MHKTANRSHVYFQIPKVKTKVCTSDKTSHKGVINIVCIAGGRAKIEFCSLLSVP